LDRSSGTSQELGWLKASGGEIRDEFTVGQEEIVVGELAGESPGDLLEDSGGDIAFGVLGGVKMDFEFFGGGGVLMADAGDFDGFAEGDAEFFAKFAREGLSERFARADFAAGEFPLQGRGVAASTLADEDAAVGTFDNGSDNVDHRSKR
jgi:hypothetical protein